MIPNEEEALIKKAMEAAKKTPQGMDFPVLGPEQKFPINLYCNDDLLPSTSANNRSVYTRWLRNGTGLVNLYVNGEALKVLEDDSDKPKFIWLLESREIIPDQYKFIDCLLYTSDAADEP